MTEDAAAIEKARLIAELQEGARWCAGRKVSHTGKRSEAYWMNPDMGDPAWPNATPEALNWVGRNLGRFQALVKKTREEMNAIAEVPAVLDRREGHEGV